MLKATLQFTNYLCDDKNVFGTLSNFNIEIIKSKMPEFSTKATVTILVNSHEDLNCVLGALNKNTIYGVSVLKVKRKRF